MRIQTVPYKATFDYVRRFIVHPLIMCKAEPLAAVHVVKFEELRLGWDATYDIKLAIDDKGSEAQALVDTCRMGLGRCAGRVSKAILTITDDNRDDPLFTTHFGNKVLSVFKRRFLSMLAAMRGWIPNLKISEHASLVALADDVEQAVKAMDAALAMRADVKAEKRYFRDVGARKKLIDKVNIVCKAIHGELGRFPHEMPSLPTDFADQFFLSKSHDEDEDKDEDEDESEEAEDKDPIEAANARITELTEDLAAAQDHLKAVVAEKAAAAAKAAALEAEAAVIAALEAEAADKVKLAAKLKAKLKAKLEADQQT